MDLVFAVVCAVGYPCYTTEIAQSFSDYVLYIISCTVLFWLLQL